MPTLCRTCLRTLSDRCIDMRRFVIFLIRKHLGLKKYEKFKFTNQKTDAVYYFTESGIMKQWRGETTLSGVSVNWVLDNDCKIEKEVIA